MLSWEEEQRIFKAINNVSKKINEIQKQLDDYINSKDKENKNSINIDENAILELAKLIDEKDGGQ